MKLRSISPILTVLCLAAVAPSACGGDSDEKGADDGASGEGGDAGRGGSGGDLGGSSGRGGNTNTGGNAGRAGSASTGGRGGSAGTAGDAGSPGEGGLGGGGGEGGGEGGEPGAGGQPGCAIGSTATVSGTLKVTADDNYRLYVNGALVDETARLWTAPQTYTVNLFRHPAQKNVIAIEGINQLEINGLDRGIIADLTFDAGAGAQSVVTDASWKLSTTDVTNWFTVAFNDASWVAATDEGAHGIAPYYAVLGSSNAHWIWAYDADVAATEKADPPEHVWVRKSFYLNVAGAVTNASSSCP